MSSLLIFVGALAAMWLLAVIINKISGAKAHYMDQLVLMPGEIKITEDREADFHVITSLGKAAYMSFARPRRTHVVLTDCRMVIASKVLFGGRYMITHMLYFTRDKAPAVELDKVSGGLYSRGYLIMQTDRSTMTAEMDGTKPFIRIVPVATASATNIEHGRLYSENAENILRAAKGGGLV